MIEVQLLYFILLPLLYHYSSIEYEIYAEIELVNMRPLLF